MIFLRFFGYLCVYMPPSPHRSGKEKQKSLGYNSEANVGCAVVLLFGEIKNQTRCMDVQRVRVLVLLSVYTVAAFGFV